MPNYIDRYLPTPLGFKNYQYLKPGDKLMVVDPPILSPGAISFVGDIRETKYYLLHLERDIALPYNCCKHQYLGEPYQLDVQVSEYQYLKLLDGSFTKPEDSLNQRLWVPKSSDYGIMTLFDVPPYWYSALLGAGCAGNEDPPLISFPNSEYRELMARFDTRSYYVGPSERDYTPLVSYKYFSGKSELWRDLNNLEYTDTSWWNAFIPTVYKFGVFEDRLWFVKGLMDYKGWVDGITGKSKILITSKMLHDDLFWLVRSIGGWAETETLGCSGAEGGWLMTVYLPDYIHPFGVARDNYIPTVIDVPPWKVKRVESIEAGSYKSVMTVGQSGYSLAGEVIVRHQT